MNVKYEKLSGNYCRKYVRRFFIIIIIGFVLFVSKPKNKVKINIDIRGAFTHKKIDSCDRSNCTQVTHKKKIVIKLKKRYVLYDDRVWRAAYAIVKNTRTRVVELINCENQY